MIYENAVKLYKQLRLMNYSDIFRKIKEKDGSLSATESFAVDVIYLLGNPSVSEFANYLGISQPNATYKINNLTAKGYITKNISDDDKRECRLSVDKKFYQYFDTEVGFIKKAALKVNEAFSAAEITVFEKVLDVFIKTLQKAEE